MPRLWLIWLPTLYVATICLAGVDMALALTGNGETNLGAWIYIFSFVPTILVSKAAGIDMYSPPANPVMFTVLQALGLLLVGAAIDALRLRNRNSKIGLKPNKSVERTRER